MTGVWRLGQQRPVPWHVLRPNRRSIRAQNDGNWELDRLPRKVSWVLGHFDISLGGYPYRLSIWANINFHKIQRSISTTWTVYYNPVLIGKHVNFKHMNMNIPPLEHFVDNKVLSRSMATKFKFPSLRHNICFNEVHNGSVRVTRSKKIIESIVSKKKKSFNILFISNCVI